MTEEELIETLAAGILKRGLEAPAIFALEMYKPLSGVFYNLSLAVYPMLNAIVGLDKVKETASVMKSPELIEKLIKLLELRVMERKAGTCRE